VGVVAVNVIGDPMGGNPAAGNPQRAQGSAVNDIALDMNVDAVTGGPRHVEVERERESRLSL
jgi:hypothetical protein